MNEGLDLRVWLTFVGVLVVFFGLPFAFLERDRRKKEQASDNAE